MGEGVFHGLDGEALAKHLGLPSCEVFGRVASTMDLAHATALEGAPAGTLILADAQDAGRGRGGRQWVSPAGGGIWMTMVERPDSAKGLDVLSLRLGLLLAESLDRLAGAHIRLKWPNDLYVGHRKLAGILVEARWREHQVDWVAIGLGLNVLAPLDVPSAAGLAEGTTRLAALEAVVRAVREAARGEGPLTFEELARYTARDYSIRRRVTQPAAGTVMGVNASGELMLETANGVVCCRSGSIAYAEES